MYRIVIGISDIANIELLMYTTKNGLLYVTSEETRHGPETHCDHQAEQAKRPPAQPTAQAKSLLYRRHAHA